MSTEGLMIALICTLLVGVWVLFPVVNRRARHAADMTDHRRERLLVYYERVLRNLRDLDEDHALGKLDDDSYARERALWAERGVEALRTLDTLDVRNAADAPALPVTDSATLDAAIDSAIEAAVAAARTRTAGETHT